MKSAARIMQMKRKQRNANQHIKSSRCWTADTDPGNLSRLLSQFAYGMDSRQHTRGNRGNESMVMLIPPVLFFLRFQNLSFISFHPLLSLKKNSKIENSQPSAVLTVHSPSLSFNFIPSELKFGNTALDALLPKI